MTMNVLVAVTFHAAVGGAVLLSGSFGDAQPALPVSDIIMVEVFSPQPSKEMIQPAQSVIEPVKESAPETPVITEKTIPAVNNGTRVQRVFDTPPVPVFDENIAVALPAYEVPKKKPVPKPMPLDKTPLSGVRVTEYNAPSLERDTPEIIKDSPPLISSANQAQEDGGNQPIQNGLTPSTEVAYASNPKPVYPQQARRRRQEGVVTLWVQVGADGRAISVRIKKSSGYRLLDRAAKRAIATWTFTPATLLGLPVKSTAEVPVRFFLDNT